MALMQMGEPFEKKYTQFSDADIQKVVSTYHQGQLPGYSEAPASLNITQKTPSSPRMVEAPASPNKTTQAHTLSNTNPYQNIPKLCYSATFDKIAIPEIQCPLVWKAAKVRDFIDSLYQGNPVGYIITWRNPYVKLKNGVTPKQYNQGANLVYTEQATNIKIGALASSTYTEKVKTKINSSTTNVSISDNEAILI